MFFRFRSFKKLKEKSLDFFKELKSISLSKERQEQLNLINRLIYSVNSADVTSYELMKLEFSAIINTIDKEIPIRIKLVNASIDINDKDQVEQLLSNKDRLEKLIIEKEALVRLIDRITQDKNIILFFSKLGDEEKAIILTGAWLALKPQIEYEYSGLLNLWLSYVKENTPDTDPVYKKIDNIIGISCLNQIDQISIIKASQALDSYLSIMKKFDIFRVPGIENIPDADIRSHVFRYQLKKKQVNSLPPEKEIVKYRSTTLELIRSFDQSNLFHYIDADDESGPDVQINDVPPEQRMSWKNGYRPEDVEKTRLAWFASKADTPGIPEEEIQNRPTL